MDYIVTYQQDTVKVKSLLKTLPEIGESKLNIGRTPIAVEEIQERPRTQAQTDTAPQKPSFAQLRYWRWLREQKLLIDSSRYIQPKNEVKLVPSVVAEKKGFSLPVRKIEAVNTDWLTILLLLFLVLFATIKISYSKYLNHLFQSIINYPTAIRMFREKNYPAFHGAYRLEAYFYLTLSVFIFQLLNFYEIEVFRTNFLLYLACIIFVLLYFFVKKWTYKLLGSLFEGTSETSEYLFNMDNFNRVAGFFLFPVILIIAFYPSQNPVIPVVTGICIVGIFYLFMLQRGILILFKKQFSKFYLFLYLCTLEFLPLLIIYKVVAR